jgi:ribosomal protein L12E/L44/L45/RPP1/RPP2
MTSTKGAQLWTPLAVSRKKNKHEEEASKQASKQASKEQDEEEEEEEEEEVGKNRNLCALDFTAWGTCAH